MKTLIGRWQTWAGFGVAAVLLFGVAPAVLSSFRLGLLGQYLCYAIVAAGIGLAWGRGGMLVLVIMFHAFWIRLITSSFLKRSKSAGAHAGLWRADLLFAATVVALLSLHMAEVFVWSVALVFGNIVEGWARASYFAANCYTALGEPFSLPHAWRLLPPIIAISGIFTFAWTASVLVNFVARYNDLRAETMARREKSGTPKE